MLNGAGMLHGGCVAYLIDKWALNYRAIHESDTYLRHSCCSTPLVVLGLVNHVNGVGVTQSMSIFFHAPAPMWASLIEIRVLHSHYHYSGTSLRIISTSIALGGRVMSSRCEVRFRVRRHRHESPRCFRSLIKTRVGWSLQPSWTRCSQSSYDLVTAPIWRIKT